MTGEQTWTVGDFSVLVLVHGRADHLRRLLAGVNASKLRPTEVVIVYMDDSCPAPLRCDVPLRIIHISSSQSHSGLPLSQAPRLRHHPLQLLHRHPRREIRHDILLPRLPEHQTLFSWMWILFHRRTCSALSCRC